MLTGANPAKIGTEKNMLMHQLEAFESEPLCNSIPLHFNLHFPLSLAFQFIIHHINKDLKEMGTSCEDVKREALNRLSWRRSVRSCFGVRWHGAAVS